MSHHLKLVVCFIAAFCTAAVVAQDAPNAKVPAQTSGSPVAYVYISNASDNGPYVINGFAAAANGALIPISGSPFSSPSQLMSMVANGKYLFASDFSDIYSFSIAADGNLQQAATMDPKQFGFGVPLSLFLDHTGTTLYNQSYDSNQYYQYFGIDKPTGQLNYLGTNSVNGPGYNSALSFIGNNKYGYSASCYHFIANVFGFERNSDGTLTYLNQTAPFPVAPAGQGYCPYLAAADTGNNLAVSVQAINGYQAPTGVAHLAVYTADSTGHLSTSSTYQNMPLTAVKTIGSLQMSPSGNLLAVSGSAGLQVFHFNGGNPITHFSGLIIKGEVGQMFWDNANHLYAISADKLYVFTITPTSLRQAPGSPYAIESPSALIVLPKT